LNRGGKRWRPVLLLLTAEALGKQADDVVDFVSLCEIVHNGTLAVDDIEDNSDLRRGKPALHLMFGVDVAINAGNAMYYLPLLVLKERKATLAPATLIAAYEVYAQEMINLHFGQGMDIWWHSGKGADPNSQQYLQMCAFKTGTLARLSAKLAALVCGATPPQVEAIGRFAETIGVAFQIQDDILNLAGDKFSELKGLGEDIHEGKRTLMVLHCFEHATPEKAARLKAILNSHPSDQAVINEAIDIIKSTNSIAHAAKVARDIVAEAWKDVETSLPDTPAKLKLKAFADYLVEREI
jgi:geranylgeranyl pyrophosphate synthase